MSKYPVKEALEAQKKAYAPYSGFKVGAALLCENGKVYKGCNVENASYPVSLCAERSAIASAVADGNRSFKAIVIVGGDDYCFPCGMCRQALAEFVDGDFRVVLVKNEKETKVYKLKELLPECFVLDK